MTTQTIDVRQKGTISSLYVLKALCALFVVILHTPLGALTDYAKCISHTSVPLFYMITGFFLYSADAHRVSSRAFGTAKKAIVLWLICNLVYYPLGPIVGSFQDTYMLYFKWLVLGQTPSGGHLWYLMSLVQGALVIGLMFRFGLGRLFPWLMGLWFVGFLFEGYRPVFFGSEPSMMACNFVIKSLPCLAAGMWVAKERQALLRFKYWWVVLALAVTLLYADLIYLKPCVLPSYIVLAPFLTTAIILSGFLTCLSRPSVGEGTKVEYIGRALSGNIYYWHGLFIMLFTRVLTQYVDIYETYGSIIVFVLSLAFAYLLVKIQDAFGWNVIR